MSKGDIAVIGMAARFPGAPSIAEFWTNVRDGVESIRRLTDEELLAAGVTRAEFDDRDYVKACPVLNGIDQFDAAFFGFNPRDASVMDPAHRLFLELAWEAIEHSGHTALPDEGAVGVFAGSGAPYYLMDNVRRNSALMKSMGEFLVRHTNNDMNFLATRVSYEMDLRGPSINIQTACSTALVSVHMACESIRSGDCVLALAGGSTVLIPDRQGYMYQEGEILSPDGHCRPFDEKSAGTVFGSGSGCVVLKSLQAALDDGDTIHAVIKGSAVNNDGALRVGYLAPGVEGQAAVVTKALEEAGVPADSITYIETHGTGTSVGDPIEVEGLNQAFRAYTSRRRYCAIGSVKSNVGHLGEAAGIASLIKAIMAMKHRQLPPSLGYEKPNPQIDFDDSPFFVNDRLRSWDAPAGAPLRCGVTALGAGGTNCHMILEEAPERIDGEGARAVQIMVLSAKTEEALEQARENMAQAIEDDANVDLADAAYTLAVGRRAMPFRCALTVRSREQAVEQLRQRDAKQVMTGHADDSAATVVFMFPGGGAQYAGMGRELYEQEEVYRVAVDECFAIVNPQLGRDLGKLMFCDVADIARAARTLEQPSLSLPSLFTTEYALAKLFQSWGVEPAALLGHSMGEYVAACLSGVMSLEDALRLVMLRGKLFGSVPRGRMLSVSLPENELRKLMPDGLNIAAVNAPELCVASGPEALIETLERLLAEREIDCTRIHIDVAAHSAMLDPVLDTFRQFCRSIDFQQPQIPFLSNLTGKWISAAEAIDPEYWVKHLRSTVRFADCLETLRSGGERVLLEVGPGRTLSTLSRAQRNPARHSMNSMRHPDEVASDLDFALITLGKLWIAGAPVEWTALYDGQLRNRVPLPTYPWEHQRHWVDAPIVTVVAQPTARDDSRRDRIDDWFTRPSWRQTLPPPPLGHSDERVLIFADSAGLGELIAARLSATGRRVLRVNAGTEWRQTDDRFTMRPSAPSDYENLIKALVADGGIPQRVVHTWGVTSGAQPAEIGSVMEHGFHSLLCFAQALSNEDPEARFTLDVVTNDLQQIGGETLLQPLKAVLLGPSRVMPQEFPNVRSRAVDIVLPSAGFQREAIATLVAAEVVSEPIDDTVAFRGQQRFAQSLEPVSLETGASRLRDRGVYLITGGLGGIGYTLAEHLARTRRARLVLTGRGATLTRSSARVTALEALGAEVEVVQADVTSVTQMSAAVARTNERFGALHGVFHAAGTLGDSLMPLKTREDAERVLAPKVQGTLALDAALGNTPLDLFVLFSSISSIAGLPGQADYTAANAFLDAFAYERSARDGTFAIAINWSAWRDVGMAANIASGAGSGGGVGEEIHPVLGRRIWASAEAELFAADLSVSSHWVLAEHRLRGGRSLMPGTGLLDIARAALEARPEPRPLEIRDLAFLSPFVVQDDAPRELRVHLGRNGSDSQTLVIAGRSAGDDGKPSWQEHVTATVGYVNGDEPRILDLAAIAARCTVSEQKFGDGERSPHMDFGPRWRNKRSIRYGNGEALAVLELPSEFAKDSVAYRLHPALMDMATACGWALVPGFDPANDFYVPLSYTRLRMFAPLPARIYSHVRLVPSEFDPKEIVVFDVTITDEAGRELVDIEGFMMTRVTDSRVLEGTDARFGKRRSHANFDPPPITTQLPPLVKWLDGAIHSGEGMQALEKIIAGPALAQVFATPKPVNSLMAELRQPQVHAAPARAVAPAAPTAPLAEIEAVLATHEVVRECVVLQRPNKPGELTLVGYVVFEQGQQATVSDLRRFLKARLPEHVVRTFVELNSLPRTMDGSVDRVALPDPFGVADKHVAPRTETETIIADIWKEVLGVDRVSIHDNFFDAGGHSLLAVRVVVRIDKKLGVRLNQAMMVLQTLEQIAAECDKRRSVVAAAAAAKPVVQESGGIGQKLRNVIFGQ